MKLRLYLDTCCYNRLFDDWTQQQVRQEAQAVQTVLERVQRNEIELVWSTFLDLENHKNPYEERKREVAQYKKLATLIAMLTDDVSSLAKQIEKSAGLKSMDALHISSAIISQCDFFLTTDKRILRSRISTITLRNPSDFILL